MKVILVNSSIVFANNKAKEILDHYTKGLTEKKRDAIIAFFKAVDYKGLTNEIQRMFIPMISSGLTECAYDAISKEQFSPTIAMVYDDVYGFKTTDNTNADMYSSLSIPMTINNYDVHIGYYQLNRLNSIRQKLLASPVALQPMFTDTKLTYYGTPTNLITANNVDTYVTGNHVVSTRIKIDRNPLSSDNLKSIFDGTDCILEFPTSDTYFYTNNELRIAPVEQYAYNDKTCYEIIVVTNSLSDENALFFNKAIQDLQNAFFTN